MPRKKQSGIVTQEEKKKNARTDFRQGSGEDDDLVDFSHLFQKVVDPGAFDDIYVVGLRFDLNRDDVVGLGDHLERPDRGLGKK